MCSDVLNQRAKKASLVEIAYCKCQSPYVVLNRSKK